MIYLIIISLFGAHSTGGYYAIIISTVLLMALSVSYIKKNIVNIVVLAVVVIGMLIVTNIFIDNRIGEKFNFLSISSEMGELGREAKIIFIDNIILGSDDVFIDTSYKDFTVRNSGNEISVKDPQGRDLPVYILDEGETDVFPGNIIPFEDPDYKDYVIVANEDYSMFSVQTADKNMLFHMTEEGVMVPGRNNTLDTIHSIERNAFMYRYSYLFSGRGYIWSGMLPLLNDTVIIGNGPDTTFLTYPQNDYIGIINMTGKYNYIIEKPHNYYLQLAHDTGWVSLALLLTLFGYYIINTFILLIKKKLHGIHRRGSNCYIMWCHWVFDRFNYV